MLLCFVVWHNDLITCTGHPFIRSLLRDALDINGTVSPMCIRLAKYVYVQDLPPFPCFLLAAICLIACISMFCSNASQSYNLRVWREDAGRQFGWAVWLAVVGVVLCLITAGIHIAEAVLISRQFRREEREAKAKEAAAEQEAEQDLMELQEEEQQPPQSIPECVGNALAFV